ncbi:hypothetical protein [Terriglobus albidus]|uniref:hypothetical protein n=1 Tax=Terriglobus albidus TaxID=1592106 RepID=UPI00164D44B4|nr:hypothetical protein [Terriglobus albidus]
MEFNGKDDYLARWIHGISAIVLGFAGVILLRFFGDYNRWDLRLNLAGFAALLLAIRCAWYAISGRGNPNND